MPAAFRKVADGLAEALLVARGEIEPVRCTIPYRVLRHERSGLLIAVGDDPKALMKAATTDEQLRHDLRAAIYQMLEAEGRPAKFVVLRHPEIAE